MELFAFSSELKISSTEHAQTTKRLVELPQATACDGKMYKEVYGNPWQGSEEKFLLLFHD